MRFIIKHFVIFITIVVFPGCRQAKSHLQKIDGQKLTISGKITPDDHLEAFISPFKTHLDSLLSEELCYAPRTMAKTESPYNTAIGNLLCDMVYTQVNPIFQSRTGHNIDVILLNYGGIRAGISRGPVTRKTAYEVMPFENTVEVLELTPERMEDLVAFLANSKRAHPFWGMEIHLDARGALQHYSIQGAPLNRDKTYYVATSNYLADLGDNMHFFQDPLSRKSMDYLVRNAMIDYFAKQDTLTTVKDNRFTGP